MKRVLSCKSCLQEGLKHGNRRNLNEYILCIRSSLLTSDNGKLSKKTQSWFRSNYGPPQAVTYIVHSPLIISTRNVRELMKACSGMPAQLPCSQRQNFSALLELFELSLRIQNIPFQAAASPLCVCIYSTYKNSAATAATAHIWLLNLGFWTQVKGLLGHISLLSSPTYSSAFLKEDISNNNVKCQRTEKMKEKSYESKQNQECSN